MLSFKIGKNNDSLWFPLALSGPLPVSRRPDAADPNFDAVVPTKPDAAVLMAEVKCDAVVPTKPDAALPIEFADVAAADQNDFTTVGM